MKRRFAFSAGDNAFTLFLTPSVLYSAHSQQHSFLRALRLRGRLFRIAGFLRLSLPHDDAVRALVEELAGAAGQTGRRDRDAGAGVYAGR